MKKTFTLLCICFALSLVGCIDRDFDLAKTNTEITIGGEELVVPLGEISKITLGDLLGENETLKPNQDGVYQIAFSSFGDNPDKYEMISIDGISIPSISCNLPQLQPITFSMGELPTTLGLSAINHEFDVDFPSIGNIMNIKALSVVQNIAFSLPSQISGEGAIDKRTLSFLQMSNMASIKSNSDNDNGAHEVVFDAKISILEQLNKVDWVEFGCDIHPYGTPFTINVDLNGMHDINGGGELKLNVEFPEGYYLRDENGNDFPQATHNLFSQTYTIQPKQKIISVLLYLHRIDYSDHTFEQGELKIDDHIRYSYDLKLNLCEGNYNLNNQPKITFEAMPQYKDIEVVINHFEGPSLNHNLSYTFNGMPSGVAIEKIAFKENSKLNISLKGLEWFTVKDNKTGDNISPKIELDLPRCMHFRNHALLNNETNVLMATAAELATGVTLSLEYIDCTENEGVKQENGSLQINESIVAKLHMESLDGHTVLVSSVTPPENLKVEVGIAESQLELDIENTKVNWSEDKSFDFNLGSGNTPSISTSIDVPEMISSIKRIEIVNANSQDKEPVSLSFALEANKSFPVEELDVNVSVNLGKMLHPTKEMFEQGLIQTNDNGDYIFTINETWSPREASLTKTLKFDALENIPAIVDGKLAINQNFPVMGSVKIKSGESLNLSAEDAKVEVKLHLDDIKVSTFKGGVNFEYKPETIFVELGDMGDLGVNINSLSLNPVLKLKLSENPTGVALNADVVLTTYDANNNKLTTITVPTITVNGSGKTDIVISTPRNEAKYSGEGVTFIAIDNLAKLLSNGIPAKIGVDMAVKSNKNDICTIDLSSAEKGYNIGYQYEVVVPLEFDGDIDLSYETSIMGLNETFVSLADELKSVKVGDIGLIAEIGSTIPFTLVLSAELVNAEGTTEGIAARLNIDKCRIDGYNKDKDGEKQVSNIDLEFDLGESGSLEGLRNADGVRIKFTLYGTDADVAALANTQGVDGKLKLRVRNGLTIDIFDFLKGVEE